MRKIRVRYRKEGRAAYLSHLDTMRTLQRSITRARLSVKYSEGFNPHAYLSIALPLSLGYTSGWELMDIVMLDETPGEEICARLNQVLPEGFFAEEAYEEARKVREIASAVYQITMIYDAGVPENCAEELRRLFTTAPLMLVKKSKRGEKEVDLLTFIKEISVIEQNGEIQLRATLAAGNDNLNPDYLLRAVETYLPACQPDFARIHRISVLDENLKEFR